MRPQPLNRPVFDGEGDFARHLLLGFAVVVALWLTFWLHSRGRGSYRKLSSGWWLSAEVSVCPLIAITAHLGGILSGVNDPPASSTAYKTVLIHRLYWISTK